MQEKITKKTDISAKKRECKFTIVCSMLNISSNFVSTLLVPSQSLPSPLSCTGFSLII